MNKKVIIVIAVLALSLAALLIPNPLEAQTPVREAQKCPEGSYDIGITKNGEPLCKLEPTGCPYGDSIPLEVCDKFAPQPEPKTEISEPEPEPEMVETNNIEVIYGK